MFWKIGLPNCTLISFPVDVRRGREGIVDIPKDMWEKKYHEASGLFFYEKVRGELSKNHARDQVCPFNYISITRGLRCT